jgi:hypothetical protein
MSMTRTTLLALFLALPLAPVLSQHQHAHTASPYAGHERRALKALSD